MSTGSREEYLARLKRQERNRLLARLLIFVLFVGLWEFTAAIGVIDPFLFSKPSSAARLLWESALQGELWKHVGVTLGETAMGFLLGTALGLAMAILLWWFPQLAKVLDPYLVILNSMPKIALGPIFIVWLGNGTGAILTMALTISVISTTTIIYSGFLEVPAGYQQLMKVFGATRKQTLTKVILPGSVPTMMAALRVNIGLTLVGVIVGEFLVSRAGLGYLIIYGGQVFNLNLVVSSIVVLAALAALLYQAVAWMEVKLTENKSNFSLPDKGI